jgi:hypothetical protein
MAKGVQRGKTPLRTAIIPLCQRGTKGDWLSPSRRLPRLLPAELGEWFAITVGERMGARGLKKIENE